MTTKKRANNDGSLYWSEVEKIWIGQITLPDGKRIKKRNKLQRIVKTWLDEQKELIKEGTWIANESTKYGDFLDQYMSEIAEHTLKPKTIENYYFIIKNHIKPELGDLKLSAIRPETLQSLYASRLAKGLSKHTVVYIHSVIHKTLETALKWGLVGRNVSDAVNVPRPEKNEIHPLTVDEVKKLLSVLEGDRLYAYYVLMCTSGIRKGECLGIQKEDLNLDAGTITIRHSISQVRGKGMILQEPKSEKSRRELAIPSLTVTVLQEHLDKHPTNSGYVFATSNGTPFSPRNILRHFKSKLKEAGLPEETRIHDLRHSFISWLIASGMSVRDVADIAGHAQVTTTLSVYAHMLPGAKREAADKIGGMFA